MLKTMGKVFVYSVVVSVGVLTGVAIVHLGVTSGAADRMVEKGVKCYRVLRTVGGKGSVVPGDDDNVDSGRVASFQGCDDTTVLRGVGRRCRISFC